MDTNISDWRKHNNSFKTHKATLVQNTDRCCIIDWRKSDCSSHYYVCFILDKLTGTLIINGDLGECMASWHNRLEPLQLAKLIRNDPHYFVQKIKCSSDKHIFEHKDVKADIWDRLNIRDVARYARNNEDFQKTRPLRDYINVEIAKSITGRSFVPTEELKDILEEIDRDSWEWLYQCGERIHERVYLWIEGFCQACQQLKDELTIKE